MAGAPEAAEGRGKQQVAEVVSRQQKDARRPPLRRAELRVNDGWGAPPGRRHKPSVVTHYQHQPWDSSRRGVGHVGQGVRVPSLRSYSVMYFKSVTVTL